MIGVGGWAATVAAAARPRALRPLRSGGGEGACVRWGASRGGAPTLPAARSWGAQCSGGAQQLLQGAARGTGRRGGAKAASGVDRGAGAGATATAAGAAGAASGGGGDKTPLEYLLEVEGGRITYAAQLSWEQFLRKGDVVVDATMGNGHDTLFLAEAVLEGAEGGEMVRGRVVAFDIQQQALDSTRALLEARLPPGHLQGVELVCGCHSRITEAVGAGTAKLIAFNLGYLPKGDKNVKTTAPTSCAAVEAALKALAPGGVISIMCYPKHEGGREEYEALVGLAAGLGTGRYTSSEHRIINRSGSPILLMIYRRADDR